jgi:putative ABC transport system ATP-binding protein
VGDSPLISLRGVVKNYQALRPLRIEALDLNPGDILSLSGLDAPAAELLVGLLTGALLPDSGEVFLFGQATREVNDSDAWLRMLDGVGIVTDRAVLIPQFSVEQNIAMPFTLEIDPVAAGVRPRVADLAKEVGLQSADLAAPVGQSSAEVNARVRLARALALDPRVLLAEHPSATLPRESVKTYASDLGRVARSRHLAILAVTADDTFARSLGGELLRLEPATGQVRRESRWHKLFRGS